MKKLFYLASLLAFVVATHGAAPAYSSFDTNYFKAISPKVSLLGSLTNWQKLSTNSVASGSNWAASGTTNSTLAGNLSANAGTFTNGASFGGPGPSVFTNGVQLLSSSSYALTTTWTALNSGTNYAADLSLPVLHFNMTTNINLLHTTNGTANFTASFVKGANIMIINDRGTNFPITWPATWHTVGSVLSGFTLTNGDWCSVAIQFSGVTTSQTNNWIAVAYKGH